MKVSVNQPAPAGGRWEQVRHPYAKNRRQQDAATLPARPDTYSTRTGYVPTHELQSAPERRRVTRL